MSRELDSQTLAAEFCKNGSLRGYRIEATARPCPIYGNKRVAESLPVCWIHRPPAARLPQHLRRGALRHHRQHRPPGSEVLEKLGGNQIHRVPRGLKQEKYTGPSELSQSSFVLDTRKEFDVHGESGTLDGLLHLLRLCEQASPEEAESKTRGVHKSRLDRPSRCLQERPRIAKSRIDAAGVHDDQLVRRRCRWSTHTEKVVLVISVRDGRKLRSRLSRVSSSERVSESRCARHDTIRASHNETLKPSRRAMNDPGRARLRGLFVPWVTEIRHPRRPSFA